MASLNASLRAQLLDIAQQLLTASINGTAQTDEIKDEVDEMLSVLALYQTDLRTSLEQVSELLENSSVSSNASALALVTRAVASLPLPPTTTNASPPPSSDQINSFPLPTELITHIIDLIHPPEEYHERQETFLSLSLVSHSFYNAVKPLLDMELTITDVLQFKGLYEKLRADKSVFDKLRYFTLDFDTTRLKHSLADEKDGKDWMEPLAKEVMLAFTTVQDLTIGVDLWDSCSEGDPVNFFQSFERQTHYAISRIWRPVAVRLIDAFAHTYSMLYSFLYDNPWKESMRRLSVGTTLAEEEIVRAATFGNWSGLAKLDLIELATPNLLISPSELLNILPTPSSLRTLSFTLFLNDSTSIPLLTTQLTTLFQHLSSTLSLSLRLLNRLSSPNSPESEALHDSILSSLGTLPHLRSLEVGGNISFLAHWDPTLNRPSDSWFISLGSLPHLTSLTLLPMTPQPFIDDTDSSPSLSLGYDTDLRHHLDPEEGLFEALQVLTIYYDDLERFTCPVRLWEVCEIRGVELRVRDKRLLDREEVQEEEE